MSILIKEAPFGAAQVEGNKESVPSDFHLAFWCPGCKCLHSYYVLPERNPETNAGWNFNGDMEKPSFTPSLLYSGKTYPGRQCHLYVTEGKIHYCGDCDHELSGKVVDMVDLDTLL